MLALTGQDVLDAVGLPAASEADLAWSDKAAAATNAYVNALPIASLPEHGDDVLMAGLMLASNLYTRRPAGSLSPDGDLATAPLAVDNVIARLLRIGGYQKPVIGKPAVQP